MKECHLMELKIRRINTGYVLTLSVEAELAGAWVFEQWHYEKLEDALSQVKKIADFMCTKSHKELRLALKNGSVI